VGDRFRPLWDLDDIDGTEDRLLAQFDREESDGGRAEALTQLARVCGLRGQFAEGEEILERATALGGSDAIVAVRLALERGRLRRSSGDVEVARDLFQSAFGLADRAGDQFLAADAAHMAALAAPDLASMLEWTRRGLDISESSLDPAVSNWSGSLLNNLGCCYADAGDHEAALDAFQRALEARLRHPEWPANIRHARESLAEELRALGRDDEARQVASSGSAG
jgi:tetratricopeptide (TPR) repeat protein